MAEDSVENKFAALYALPSEERYKSFMKKTLLEPESEILIDGSKILWIGAKTADNILVYVPGGGLILPLMEPQLEMVYKGMQAIENNGRTVATAVISYDLAPTSPYPSQLRQLKIAADYILKDRSAGSIHFIGDSAGGMLIMSLLLHYHHEHANIPKFQLPNQEKFGTAILLSPTAPIPSSKASMLQDPVRDVMTLQDIKNMWGIILGACEKGVTLPNNWIDLANTPEEWWSSLPIGEVTIVVGDDELYRDDILQFSGSLKKNHSSPVTVSTFPNEKHCQPLLDLAMDATELSGSSKATYAWFENFKGVNM